MLTCLGKASVCSMGNGAKKHVLCLKSLSRKDIYQAWFGHIGCSPVLCGVSLGVQDRKAGQLLFVPWRAPALEGKLSFPLSVACFSAEQQAGMNFYQDTAWCGWLVVWFWCLLPARFAALQVFDGVACLGGIGLDIYVFGYHLLLSLMVSKMSASGSVQVK